MTCLSPVSDTMLVEAFVTVGVMWGLLILLILSRSRYVPGEPGKLPVFSTLSRWIYGTEDPRGFLFFLIMTCVLAMYFILGFHLAAQGGIIYPAC
jgi:hypothetical protein